MQEFPQYLKSKDVYYRTVLKKYPSALRRPWRALYEAFTNSWESIESKFGNDISQGHITINIYLKSSLLKEEEYFDFDKISIEDNGIGFNSENFERSTRLGDNRKGKKNRGCGRVEYLNAFETTIINSTYFDNENILSNIVFTLSKTEEFLNENAIIRIDKLESISESIKNTSATVTFRRPKVKNHSEVYTSTKLEDYLEQFLRHYLSRLCINKECLPKIEFRKYVNNKPTDTYNLNKSNLPEIVLNENIDIQYSQFVNNEIIKLDIFEYFNILGFKLTKESYKENSVYLTSKGEQATELIVSDMPKNYDFAGYRYLILISSNYLDANDSDERGNINLQTHESLVKYSKKNELFPEENKFILEENLKAAVNQVICKNFNDVDKINKSRKRNIQKIKDIFFFSSSILDKIKIDPQDTEKDLLKKY